LPFRSFHTCASGNVVLGVPTFRPAHLAQKYNDPLVTDVDKLVHLPSQFHRLFEELFLAKSRNPS
jgi:hypothetical protein